MHYLNKIVAATALTGMLAFCSYGALGTEATTLVTLKPMAGRGVGGSKHFLLDYKIGGKQTISYFQNDNGVCKLTVMVAEAFDGEQVPDSTTVRFEVGIDAGRTARVDTAEGKSLEFACQERAEEMLVKPGDHGRVYPPGT
jgi:hypothetical protein